MKRKIVLMLALLMLASGCSASQKSMADTSGNTLMYENQSWKASEAPAASPSDMNNALMQEGGAVDSGSVSGPPTLSGEFIPDATRKLIRTAYYYMETMEFDQTLPAVEALVAQYNGYIQASSATGAGAVQTYRANRSASYTIRIPVEGFFEFGKGLEDCGSITESNQSAQEVTDYYYDTEARLNTLKIQEERLLALMSQATELEAVIQLESSLGDVRYQIESHEGTLRRLDSQIAYSTIELQIYEVFEPTRIDPMARTLGERISQRFRNTWEGIVWRAENFVVWLVGDSLEIILTLAIIGLAVLLLRFMVKRAKAKRHKPAADARAEDGAAASETPEDGAGKKE